VVKKLMHTDKFYEGVPIFDQTAVI